MADTNNTNLPSFPVSWILLYFEYCETFNKGAPLTEYTKEEGLLPDLCGQRV
jgi:hypothetical protein